MNPSYWANTRHTRVATHRLDRMQGARVRRAQAGRARIAWLLSLVMMTGSLVFITSAEVAQAATIATSVTAQLANETGTDGGNNNSNCIRWSPRDGTNNQTTFVAAGVEALSAHGYSGNCPTNLDKNTQSAVGVTPSSVTSVTDGNPFLLTSIKHYNNPVTVVASHFAGDLNIRLSGFDTTPTLNFKYTLWETPNTLPCAIPAAPNLTPCDDQVTFDASISDQDLTKGGVRYRLVINGFGAPNAAGTCPATPGTTTPNNNFYTQERTTTTGCIYATLSQIRTLTVAKTVVGPAPSAQSFAYTSTSSLAGSPWASGFSLVNGGSVTRDLLQGETVNVTEAIPTPTDQWTVTSIVCTDGAGKTLGTADGVTVSTSTGQVTLANTPAPATTAAGPITCRYTNTYTPKATLTLVKTITGGSATVSNFTLSANGPSSISGVSGTAAVTAQRVAIGVYNLSESTTVTGYVPGTWTCTAGTLVGSQLTLADGQNATCTINNRYATGNFTIRKLVDDPNGGYTGGTSKTFTGTYSCANGASGTFSVTIATTWTSGQLPAGVTCTVTETAPTGGLLNASFVWGPAGYSPAGGQVTIADNATQAVVITNPVVQQFGRVSVSKVVTPRSGTPAAGYTGGTARTFPVAYSCVLTNGPTLTGTVTVTTGTPATINNIPTGAVCSFTETQTAQAGDFLDASYAWDGYAFSPTTVTVGNNTTVSTTVTNYFVQRRATLTLAKVLDGGGYIGTGTPFVLNWACGTESGSVNLAPGGSQTVNVPANTACTVVETAPSESLLDQAHDWLPATYDGLTNGTISIAPSGTGRVTVTNHTTTVYGTLSVVKRISPADLAGGVLASARFQVTVACNAPAQGGAANYSNTFSLAVGVAQSTPNLPLGTSCTVSEAAPTQDMLVDDSYAWGPTPGNQTATVSERNGTVTMTVTNTLTRVYGSLALTKVVNALGGVNGSGTTFTGTWSCTYGNSAPVTGTWSRTGAGAATLTGPNTQILIGSVCTATETGRSPERPSATDPSYVWGAETITGPVTITRANPNGQITVTNPVRRITGSFSVGKTVRGGAAGTAFVNGGFTFSWSCSDAGGNSTSGTIVTRAGATANGPADVPAGSTCTVTETGRPDAIDPYRWITGQTAFSVNGGTEQTGSSVTFTTDATGTPVTVQAINVIEPVSLSVTAVKQIQGATEGFTDTSVTFDLSLACTLNGAASTYGPQAARVGQVVTFTGVPLGSNCQLTEGTIPPGHGLADGSYQWLTPTFPDSPQTLTDRGANYRFTVVNRIGRVYGQFQLVKALDAPSGVVAADRVYSGNWRCTHAPDAAVSGTWTVTGTGVATLTGFPAQGAPINSTCTATETGGLDTPPSSDPSYSWNPPTVVDATVTAGATATVQVNNSVTRNTHDVTIRKTISGETQGYIGTGTPFQVDAVCSSPGLASLVFTINLAPGAAARVFLDDVPQGWTCQVAEVPPSNNLLRNASYAWGTPTISGTTNGSLTVTADAALVVDNPITRVLGSVQVVKAIATGTPDGIVNDDATFTGTYSCAYNAGAPDAGSWTGTWSVTGATGGTATLTPALPNLPVGTICSITENTPSASDLVDPSWQWAAPIVDPSLTVAQGGPQSLHVVNTPERVYSSMSITKTLTGATAGLVPGSTVSMAWSCDYAMSTVASGIATIPASGGTVQVFASDGSITGPGGPILVPSTSQCRVTESTLTQDQLVDASYAWGDPTYSPEGGLVITSGGTTANVTVTNTINRVYGSFRITKQIDAPAGVTVASPLTFTGDYSCQYGTDDPVTGTWTVTDQGSMDVGGILLGSQCSVTEETPTQAPVTGDPSYIWGQWTATGPVTVAGDQVAEVTVTNPLERVLSGFDIGKTVRGGAADTAFVDGDFAFDWTCTDAGGAATSGTLSTHAGSVTTGPRDVPAASTCTITESGRPDPIDPYRWVPDETAFTVDGGAEQTGSSVRFTTSATGGVVAVQAINVVESVSLSVTAVKHVEGATEGFTDTSVTFDLGLSCTLHGTTTTYGPQAARADEVVTFTGVPLGSTCQATENSIPVGQGLIDTSFEWLAPAFPDSPQTLSDRDGDYEFTVVNTIGRVYGQLQLVKALDAPAGVVASDRVYSGTWSCTHAPDDPVTGTWTVTGTGPATLSGFPAQGVPLNSVCTATETGGLDTPPSTDPSYSWNDPQVVDATVTADGVATIEVNNSVTRHTHDVTIRKTISGETQGYIGTGTPFTVNAVCSAPGATPLNYTIDLAAGGDAQVFLDNVPEGWTCEVTEVPPGTDLLRNASYAWGTPTIDGTTEGSLTVTDEAALVVDNPITRVQGSVQVVKSIAAGTPNGVVNADATFTGTYSCTYDAGAPDEASWTGTWSVTGATGGTATLTPALTDLPLGTTCSITENDPSNDDLVDASWQWAAPTVGPDVTVAPDGPQTLGVTNTPERVYSAMSITKELTGATAGLVAGSTVTMNWSCDYAGSTVASGTATIPASGGTQYVFLADGSITGADGPILVPATSQCQVTEDALTQDQLVDDSYAWGTPTYSPAGGTVTTSGDTPANVTVTNTIERAYGSVRVTKQIQAPGGVTADGGLTFSGTYSCQYGTDDPVTGDWTVTDQGSVDISGILYGSQCQVTAENTPANPPVGADPSYVWGTWTATGPVTVVKNDVAELVVTNPMERNLTSITVSKVVTGDTEGVSADEQYTFTYTCTPGTGAAVTGGSSIAAGASWTSPADIPVGSSCTVTEADLPTVQPGYAWGTVGFTVTGADGSPVVDGQSVTFDLPGSPQEQPAAVEIENPLTRLPVSYTVSKSSDPASGSTVMPGDLITYTVTLAVTGDGAVNDVVVTDDLSDVLNNASFVSSDPDQGTATLSGTTLTWNVGLLQADADGLIRLTYQVRVNDGAWGVTLRNVVTGDGEQPPVECPDCTTTTEHFTPSWTVEKTSDPASGSTVPVGSTITYTLTVTNTSADATLTGATVTDDLSDVLQYAALGNVGTGGSVSGTTLTWAVPTLAPGEQATLDYTVQVNDDAYDVSFHNVVTPGDGGSCVVCTTTHETPPKPNGPNPPLPQTGTNASIEGVLIGLLLSLGGVGALVVARRRRRD